MRPRYLLEPEIASTTEVCLLCQTHFQYYRASVNLVPFGPEVGDHAVHPGLLTAGQTIDLHMYFPFYGGYYNYTTVCLRNIKTEMNEMVSVVRERLHGVCYGT